MEHGVRIVFRGEREATTETFDVGAPGHDEVLVRTEASLISPGTELSLYTGTHSGFADPDNHWAEYPFRPGYAAVGTIVAAGDSVSAPRVGSSVFFRGAHASHARVAANRVLDVPDGLRPEVALFARLAQIAYTAIAVEPRAFRRTRVYGAGLVGNLAAQWVRSGAPDGDPGQVEIVDLNERRREIARQCGLNAVEPGTAGADPEEAAPDRVIEATGGPAVVRTALEAVAAEGSVILLGSTRGTVELDVYELIHRRQVRLIGAHEGYLRRGDPDPARDADRVTRAALTAIVDGTLRVEPLLTHVLPAVEGPGSYDRILANPSEYLGVVLDWRGGIGENQGS